jgi:hypothetical protein
MRFQEVRQLLEDESLSAETLREVARVGRSAIYEFTLPGGRTAIEAWEDLKYSADLGYWPVILGADSPAYFSESLPRDRAAVQRCLRKAERLDPEQVLEELTDFFLDAPEKLAEDRLPKHAHGPFPKKPKPHHGFTLPWNLSASKPLKTCRMLLVPTETEDGLDVPAWLGFGNFNACPPPEVHVCLLRAWNETYGLQLACLDTHTLELEVSSPPETREAALALAGQQYRYCSDIVEQGIGTIENWPRACSTEGAGTSGGIEIRQSLRGRDRYRLSRDERMMSIFHGRR